MAPRAKTSPEARPAHKLRFRLAALSLLGALCAEPALALYPKKGDSDPHAGVRDARRRVIQGIDVSRWQDDIDWQKVKDAGTRFELRADRFEVAAADTRQTGSIENGLRQLGIPARRRQHDDASLLLRPMVVVRHRTGSFRRSPEPSS